MFICVNEDFLEVFIVLIDYILTAVKVIEEDTSEQFSPAEM